MSQTSLFWHLKFSLSSPWFIVMLLICLLNYMILLEIYGHDSWLKSKIGTCSKTPPLAAVLSQVHPGGLIMEFNKGANFWHPHESFFGGCCNVWNDPLLARLIIVHSLTLTSLWPGWGLWWDKTEMPAMISFKCFNNSQFGNIMRSERFSPSGE